MSFFGGGTDFPGFYEKHGGKVLSTTIDKYCYVNVRHLPPFFEYTNNITYSLREQVNSVEEIKHPAIREAMKFLDMHDLSLSYDADLPARTFQPGPGWGQAAPLRWRCLWASMP